MQKIRCYDNQGKAVDVALADLGFDTAVYGILILAEHVLLQRDRQTKLWLLPGDQLSQGEIPQNLLEDSFNQLLKKTYTVGVLVKVEDRYIIDQRRKALHLATLYYRMERPLTPYAALPPPQHPHFEWVPLNELNRKNMLFGYTAVTATINLNN